MEITSKRIVRTENSTISEVKINGVFQCFVLEDKDRGLSNGMPLAEIQQIKIHGKTAIPTGRYRVTISFSNRFKKYLPELHEVKGFSGIRIHAGNTSVDTEGCLITGLSHKTDFVFNSKTAFDALMKKLQAVEKKEMIFITVS